MENYNKTLYTWCLLNTMRPLDLNDDELDDFMLKNITLSEFKALLETRKFKRSSTPRKPEKFLERRMYGFVPYNISPIQQGIQFDHAKDDYYNEFFNDDETTWFRTEWKTSIILNGGTSNNGHMVKQGFTETMYYGDMQSHLLMLTDNGVKVGTFKEPDLNSMLSGIVFLVDERVFDKKSYPEFVSSPLPESPTIEEFNAWNSENEVQYNNWVDKIGGPTNAFLRTYLMGKKLA